MSILAVLALSSTAFAGPMGYSSSSSSYASTTIMQETIMMNTLLLGDKVKASDVVCRGRWGTPMMPDGKGGYSLIAKENAQYIKQSKIIPPITGGPVYPPNLGRPSAVIVTDTTTTKTVTPPVIP